MLFRRASDILSRFLYLPTRVALRDSAIFTSSFHSGAKRCSYKYDFALPAPRRTYKHVEWSIIISAQAAFIFGVSCCPASAEASSVDESISEKDTGDALLSGLRRVEDGSVVSNPHTIKWRIFTDKGRDLFPKGKLDEAEKYFLSALKEAKEGFGERDPHVASSLNNLAEFYRVQKAFEKAEPLYLDAINILEEAFGPEDVRVGSALHNLGQFYLAQRKFEEARTCYERALKIKGRVLGYGHTDYADTMYHLGTVLYLQGKEKDAEALIRVSIKILEEGGLAESAVCIRRMRYLAQILVKSGRVSEAEALQRRILHVLEILKGWDSLDTVLAAEQLALTLESVGNLVEAHELMDRCLSARKHIFQEDHIQVAANMLHLARIQMLRSSQLRKINISEASTLLDSSKSLLDDSLRIARAILGHSKENGSNLLNNKGPADNGTDGHTALIILLQSLDAIGLLEVAKIELQEPRAMDHVAVESVRALRECISLYKQRGCRSPASCDGGNQLALNSLRSMERLALAALPGATAAVTVVTSSRRELPRLVADVGGRGLHGNGGAPMHPWSIREGAGFVSGGCGPATLDLFIPTAEAECGSQPEEGATLQHLQRCLQQVPLYEEKEAVTEEDGKGAGDSHEDGRRPFRRVLLAQVQHKGGL